MIECFSVNLELMSCEVEKSLKSQMQKKLWECLLAYVTVVDNSEEKCEDRHWDVTSLIDSCSCFRDLSLVLVLNNSDRHSGDVRGSLKIFKL